jgi:hypothetical protein
VFTYSEDGPQVTNVQRYGYQAQPTYLVISFNTSLETPSAQDTSNYVIRKPNGARIRVRSAIYNPTTDAVTLVLAQRLNLRTSYSLKINGTPPTGVRGSNGALLDGAFTGMPGSDFVTTITQSDLAGSAGQRPVAAVRGAKANGLLVREKRDLHKPLR